MEDHAIQRRKKLPETGGTKWIKHLNNVVCAYNRKINSATNKSPFMLFFGQPGFNNPLSRSIIVENEAILIVPAIDIDPDIALVEENAEELEKYNMVILALQEVRWKGNDTLKTKEYTVFTVEIQIILLEQTKKATDVIMGYKKYEKKDQCYDQECVDVIKNRNLASLKALQEKTEKYAQDITYFKRTKEDYKIQEIEKMAENKVIRKIYKNIRNEIRDFQARNMMVETKFYKKHLNSKMQREADHIIYEKFMKENNDHGEDGETNVLELTIDLYIFGSVSSFKYPGIASERGTHECSCDLRMNNTRQQDLLGSATHLPSNLQIYRIILRPVVMYASETLAITKIDENLLDI
ncbi:hypothetical protein CWI36_0843p0010 [Hamiltosporidium magnivora]|uniref:Uncharacterized protein n=1 Tax=Hamiltosporidium magnivora TaxID=148818 RepID=A0A4Q9LAQ9_9MICR|nr:hypothetical protein CWI36_0843p0010 [Hamiltosporidium magnivora]